MERDDKTMEVYCLCIVILLVSVWEITDYNELGMGHGMKAWCNVIICRMHEF